jgi:hypothetical protein
MSAVSPASSEEAPPRSASRSIAWRILVSPRLSRSFSKRERAGWTLVWAVLVGCFALTCASVVLVVPLHPGTHHFSVPWAIVGCLSCAVLYFGPDLVFDLCERRPRLAYLVYRVFEEIDPWRSADSPQPTCPSEMGDFLGWEASVERPADERQDALRSHVDTEQKRLRRAIATLPSAAARSIREACAIPATVPEGTDRPRPDSQLN